jgi:acetyl-CoA acyltransferase
MSWIERNEDFAAQALTVINDLGLDKARVILKSGDIALGAAGTLCSGTLVHALRHKQLKYGMVTMCVGTELGAAAPFENVQTTAGACRTIPKRSYSSSENGTEEYV